VTIYDKFFWRAALVCDGASFLRASRQMQLHRETEQVGADAYLARELLIETFVDDGLIFTKFDELVEYGQEKS